MGNLQGDPGETSYGKLQGAAGGNLQSGSELLTLLDDNGALLFDDNGADVLLDD